MKNYEDAKLKIVFYKDIDIVTASGNEEIDYEDDEEGEGGE